MNSTARSERHRSFTFTRQFVLWIGGIWSGKNPLQVNEIANELPDVDFVVVGPSRDNDLLERFKREKPSNVHYLGAVVGARKTSLIRKSSAGLSTSIKETFGWVPFEFLREGKPVICHPLDAFKELYGNLLIYADTTADFVRQVQRLRRNRFKASFDKRALLEFQQRYSMEKAADAIVRKCSGKSIAVFAIDTNQASDYVSGLFLVDWQLWRSIWDKGIKLSIISNGSRFANRFRLRGRTTLIPTALLLMEERIEHLDAENRKGAAIARKLLRFFVYTMEPLCYVFSFMKHDPSSEVILSEGHAQAAAAVAVKLVLRRKVMCLFHDDRLFAEPWDMSRPFMVRVFSTILSRFLIRYADQVLVVSGTLRKQILRFHIEPGRVSLLWD